MKRCQPALLGLISVFIVLITCTCQKGDTAKKVAIVDGQNILLSELSDRIKKEMNLSADSASIDRTNYDLLKEEILSTMIDEKVMLLRARTLSLFVSDEELSKKIEEIRAYYTDDGFTRTLSAQNVDFGVWKEELRTRMLMEKLIVTDVNAKITVTEDEARAYYKTSRKRFEPGKRVRVAQIIVREERKAKALLNRLKRGEDFAKVAREESIGPEAVSDGDLGFVIPGVMPEEIDRVLFSHAPGSISEVIKSSYGYHIFKIIEKETSSKKNWPEIKELVMAELKKQKEETAYSKWLEDLRSKVTVRIDRKLLNAMNPPGHHAE
jgi:parvulin-like peptidyl-prolyl isomerase